MARLRSPDRNGVLIGCALSEPLPGDPKLNGAYKGKLRVRELPPGLSGADLRAAEQAPAHGQLWQRGPQLIRIVKVAAMAITFREIDHGHAVRTLTRSLFLRTSHRKART